MNMLEYNVWTYNINKRKMEQYNIFNHGSFIRKIKNIFLENDNLFFSIEDFSLQLKRETMYYFWAKAEWEIVIQPWCGCRDVEKTAQKIDVFDQLMMNWNIFVKYIWDNQQEVMNYE